MRDFHILRRNTIFRELFPKCASLKAFMVTSASCPSVSLVQCWRWLLGQVQCLPQWWGAWWLKHPWRECSVHSTLCLAPFPTPLRHSFKPTLKHLAKSIPIQEGSPTDFSETWACAYMLSRIGMCSWTGALVWDREWSPYYLERLAWHSCNSSKKAFVYPEHKNFHCTRPLPSLSFSTREEGEFSLKKQGE